MEQRPLRLGDILDDYCPRERRVTNHAVVAMIEEDVKQTRCTTCDSEHIYKGARVPKRRRKETPAALYKEVLAGIPEADAVAAAAMAAPTLAMPLATPLATLPPALDIPVPVPQVDVVSAPEPIPVNSEAEEAHPPMHSDDNDQTEPYDEPQSRAADVRHADLADEPPAVDGPVHRPLIRATLPRPEGQKDARPLPEFTVRQAPPRGNGHGHSHGNGHGGFRGERMRMRASNGPGNPQGNGQREVNGNRAPSSGSRFGSRPSGAGGRPQTGRAGSPSGFRNGNGGPNGKRGRGSRG